MANQIGKRFICGTCGTETLCTKSGGGAVNCCGEEMQIKDPKKLASSD